ncbi:MAG: class I SAM-dependent RNA methyltransferase [Saprospiraceae bacterium]|nr:class I SAM-dependent RNA methyltransferase [Saprospiraceae bacterium]
MKLIAKTLEGLEEILAEELNDIGAQDILILKRAVSYTGDKTVLYKSNLLLRTCIKVLVFIKEFTISSENDLYDQAKKIVWEDYFSLEDTFAIDSVVNSTQYRHANFIALKVKDAIADRFREKFGQRPNVNTTDPTMRINVHIREEIVTLSMDSSGPSLHLRGYRKAMVNAPLNEVLAAGLVLLSGWDKKSPLCDPMCGSGTILCEAARIAANIPPQAMDKNFAFKKWKSFDPEVYQIVCEEASQKINTETMPSFTGFDHNHQAVEACRENIAAAGLSDWITISDVDFFYQEGMSDVTLMFNPPYDERLKEKDVLDFYRNIGDKLKLSFSGSTAWILSGHQEAIKNVGLRPSAKKRLLNGSIPSLFCRFDMYQGSKKQKWQNKYGDNHPTEHEN